MAMRFFGLKPSEVFGGGMPDPPERPGRPDPEPPPEPPTTLPPPGDIPTDFPIDGPIEEWPGTPPIDLGEPPPEPPPGEILGVPAPDSSETLIPRAPIPNVPAAPAGGLTSRGSFSRPGRSGFASYRGIRPPSVPEYNPRSAGSGAPFVGGGGPDREDVVEAIMRRLRR